MSDEDDDFVTKTSTFVDRNLRIIRAGTWVLAGAGVLVIIRNAYLFKWFRAVSDIPKEFITKGISLRGQVKSITQDNTLEVLHQPLIKTPQYKKYQAGTHGPVSCLLPVSLAGVEFRGGSKQWLKDNLVNSNIHFLPLGTAFEETQLSCIVYKKRKYFPRKVCINEELVNQGFAVTGNTNKILESNKRFKELFAKLLRAEAYAEKKSRGVWTKPSLLERLKDSIKLPSFLNWRKKD